MEFGLGKVSLVLEDEQPTVNTQFKNKKQMFFLCFFTGIH